MKKFYLLKLIVFLIIFSASAQTDFNSPGLHFPDHERPFHPFQEDDLHPFKDDDHLKGTFSSKGKSNLKSTKGEPLLDSTIHYDFISETDSIPSSKSVYYYVHDNKVLEIRYNWDISIENWVYDLKYEYDYDAYENTIFYANYSWNQDNMVWVGSWKYEYDYDFNGNRILYAAYMWDSVNEAWLSNMKIESEYDIQGNKVLEIRYAGDSVNEGWVYHRKINWEYNSNGRMTLETSCLWDSADEIWGYDSKSEYEYDPHGNLILRINYLWDTGDEVWGYNSKSEYEYDPHGNLILRISYNWDSDNEIWVYHSKYENEYDVNGNETLDAIYMWDGGKEIWVGSYKSESEFDANGNNTMRKRYIWDNGTYAWGYFRKVDLEYNVYGKVTSETYFNWDSNNEVWVYDMKLENEYDTHAHGNRTLWIWYTWDYGNELWMIKSKHFQYWSKTHTLFFTDISTVVGRTIEIPIQTSDLSAEENIISYQFDFKYDNTQLEYYDYSIDGTLAQGGSIQLNPTNDKLSIAWANDNPIIGEGKILKLRFKVIDGGDITPTISNALFNTSTVPVENGTITSVYKYGDIDANDHIQAYDAALALQYSVGLDPLPDVDPLPWETWRITTANVDGVGGVTANDASEILRYSAGFIDIFPVEGNDKSLKNTMADVIVTYEDGEFIFKAAGNLYGLNIFVENDFNLLGQPVVYASKIMQSSYITDMNYAFGLATAYAPDDGKTFLKIPFTSDEPASITFEMIVNSEHKTVTVDIVIAGIEDIRDENFIIYPNPVRDELYISEVEVNSKISIYDLGGKMILSTIASSTNPSIDVSGLQNGIYAIIINEGSAQRVSKFVKK